ncbi:unnamed protein product [Ceratitis capitata]|uniref:(Mediterranean fruit fly) hypothetical protein n=1 Tax=Ceratitis capitata TaxID=7213 RepID=A0A811VAD0_CERCA|nr:unnamed protein product [Ceratitis capitata]
MHNKSLVLCRNRQPSAFGERATSSEKKVANRKACFKGYRTIKTEQKSTTLNEVFQRDNRMPDDYFGQSNISTFQAFRFPDQPVNAVIEESSLIKMHAGDNSYWHHAVEGSIEYKLQGLGFPALSSRSHEDTKSSHLTCCRCILAFYKAFPALLCSHASKLKCPCSPQHKS